MFDNKDSDSTREIRDLNTHKACRFCLEVAMFLERTILEIIRDEQNTPSLGFLAYLKLP